MKKIVLVIVLFALSLSTLDLNKKTDIKSKTEEEIRAVFFSYIELNNYIGNKKSAVSKKNIEEILEKIKTMYLNTIILQVRSHADAIYNSKLFPKSIYVKQSDEDYDVLKYFITKAHQKEIKVIAWINPYRISSSNKNLNELENNPYLKPYFDKNIIYKEQGVYFNPAKEETTKLIVNGVKEVLNYQVDGILFDDYFYPNKELDLNDYEIYLKNNDYLDITSYRLKNINNMIKKVYKECKKKNISFGVSPDANLENNYQKNYADIKTWLSKDGYVDFIMPQIYYGFNNSNKPFTKVLEEWNNLIINKRINLYIALALYKTGTFDKYAGTGQNEWLESDNILMRQIILSRNQSNYRGFSLFRYDNLFNLELFESTTKKEITGLKKVLK